MGATLAGSTQLIAVWTSITALTAASKMPMYWAASTTPAMTAVCMSGRGSGSSRRSGDGLYASSDDRNLCRNHLKLLGGVIARGQCRAGTGGNRLIAQGDVDTGYRIVELRDTASKRHRDRHS